MQGRFGHMLSERVATMQRSANQNFRDMGMDVSAELLAGEESEHHMRLAEGSNSMLNRGVAA